MHSSRVVLVVVIVKAVMSGMAWAQTPEPPPAPVTAGWQDGFVLQSANGDNRLVLGLTVQADARFIFDDTQSGQASGSWDDCVAQNRLYCLQYDP